MAKKKAAPFEPNLRQPAVALGTRARRTIGNILDATREVFLTHGYAGTSIDDITTLAGVSRASRPWVQQRLYEPRVTVEDVVTSAARLLEEFLRK